MNLNNPEKSRFLTAPLSRSAGGTEACGKVIYLDQNDADYVTLKTAITEAVQKSWEYPRRDLEIILEMKRKALVKK